MTGQMWMPAPVNRLSFVSIPSPNFTRPTIPRGIKRVVLHTTESPERERGARSIAINWFSLPQAKVSAHYVLDADEVVQCVDEEYIAWHARGDNRHTVGLEMVGYSGQGAAGWGDAFSVAMLERTARLTYEICQVYSLPMVLLDSPALQRDERGITTHAAVSAAFGLSSHSDPGPTFPAWWFIERVRYAAFGGV